MGFYDMVYTNDKRFGLIESFNRSNHKYTVVFNPGKSNEYRDEYYSEELWRVV